MDKKIRNKEYQRKWYLANQEKQRLKIAANKNKLKLWIASFKNQPCHDCKQSYPYYVMDFDHRPDEIKLFNISGSFLTKRKAQIIEEMAKCDIVCANCHRQRTFMRVGIGV